MSAEVETSPGLTAEQQAVVDQPWDAHVLVTAGAGAGKTHTLVRRLDALVGRDEVETAEIAVLSFSRAAVLELRERIDAHGDSAHRVRAQTFDSWAAGLLAFAYAGRDWSGTTFDDRIRAAIGAVEQGAVEAGEYGPPAHIMIDEVQDLVGVRREMVETLLDRFGDDCGFTLVGDLAQTVYGFQIRDRDERASEIGYFFDWVRASFADDLVELRLGANFRARTEQARSALPWGPRLQSIPFDEAESAGERIHGELASLLAEAPWFGELENEFVRDALRSFDGSTAVLCRDNGQVLKISEDLTSHGVPHRVQRSTRDRSAPQWLADVLIGSASSRIGLDRFTELLETAPVPAGATPDFLWRSLRRVAGGPRGSLDLDEVRRAIADRRLPDELTAPPRSPLVISTMHRAKGLEFDRVLIVEPERLTKPKPSAKKTFDYDPSGEARLLYVAMTRARDDVYRVPPPDSRLLRRSDAAHRWYVGGWRWYVRNGVEALGTDVGREYPPGTGVDADPVETQRYLRTEVKTGDLVEFRLLHTIPAAADETPPYGVFHRGRPVAEASQSFRRDLHLLIDRRDPVRANRWPHRITGFTVDLLETQVGSAEATDRAGLGRSGCWVAPRLTGLGRFVWPDPDEAEVE